MVKLSRWFRHAFMPPWAWRRKFPSDALNAIEAAVRQSETQHRGELRFAIENALDPSLVWQGVSARQRAIQMFSNLRVWDTEENSGILIYVLLADKEVHIVADRGIHKRVQQEDWDAIAHVMEAEFRKGNFKVGALFGIEKITHILAGHFPACTENHEELPDRPVIIGH